MTLLLSKKAKLFWITFSFVIIIGALVIRFNSHPGYKKGSSTLYDNAVGGAIQLYAQRFFEGVDMSKGPCLSNDLMSGWVVDIVHNPREKIDDLPENQCQAFIEGRATHFVELDLNGNLVQVR